MPRRRRVHVSGGLYHAVLRGSHRQDIFACNSDYLCYEETVALAVRCYDASVFAYCWMTNHVHLAIQVGEAPLALVRYIHLNPVRARMVANPRDCRWSSHGAYQWFMGETPALAERDELSATARPGRTNGARRGATIYPIREIHGPAALRSLEAIAVEVAQARHVSLGQVQSARRRSDLVLARIEIARRALAEGTADPSEIARYLNRSPSALSDLLNGRGRAAAAKTEQP